MDVETNNQSTPPTQAAAPASTIGSAAPNNGGTGPVVGVIIIVAILALGAVYFWYDAKMQAPASLPADESATQTQASNDSVLDALTTTSSQDTASAIEADLNSTNTGDASATLQVQ